MATQEYTSVCDRCYAGTWYPGGDPCRMSYPVRCGECGHAKDEHRKCGGTLRAVDTSDLDPRFSRYHGTGVRIKVKWYGETITGTVSRTTGWKPAYLLMPRSDSTGSPYILNAAATIVAVKRGDKYVNV